MAGITPNEMASKLQAESFAQSRPVTSSVDDPIADTPMMVTLDTLRPYELNPRLTRNPLYDEIKASIRQRGLDAPPPITRRPDADHYIVRNGGNTRLAILRELWSETRDEQFFRILCLFRPWDERGEIVALTGHLAENELRGRLTFIERALGVEKVHDLYQQEAGKTLSQSELARRLTADGFPVPQSHISRMHDAVNYLLPAIPTVLYAGLGRHQVERLSVMRKSCERTWERYAQMETLSQPFDSLFHDVLSQFDASPDGFSTQRVQDELLGQMSDRLGVDYDLLALDLTEAGSRYRALDSEPEAAPRTISMPEPSVISNSAAGSQAVASAEQSCSLTDSTGASPDPQEAVSTNVSPKPEAPSQLLQEHTVSPGSKTERPLSDQPMVAEQGGDTHAPDLADSVFQPAPVRPDELYPISDIWYIDPCLDSPDRLRTHIAQFAREIASQSALEHCVEDHAGGIGFVCNLAELDLSRTGGEIMQLLAALGGQSQKLCNQACFDLSMLLHGRGAAPPALDDFSLVKLFRLVRLARRLWELEYGSGTSVHG